MNRAAALVLFPNPTGRQPANVCEHCKARPKYFDGSKLHPYCGKTCALISQTQPLCVICSTKPQYNDGNKTYQYCGKTCAAKGQFLGISKPNKPVAPKLVGPVCAIPGCQRAAYVDPSGGPSTYCSLKHKKLAEEACLWCKKVPKKTSPGLLEVPEGHATFKSIAEQFKVSWRYTTRQCPPVRRVYKIVASQASLDKYEAYRDSVEARGHFKASGKSAGNENRRWHGTRRDCNLGAPGHTQFCASATCFLCCIIKTTFKKSLGGQFGAGIYTSSTSSKSDAFSRNTNASQLKAMLLSKVVVGKGCKMTQNSTALTAPPAGYDSVLAEVGGGLTDDELVVYSEDAARPSYLLMYEP